MTPYHRQLYLKAARFFQQLLLALRPSPAAAASLSTPGYPNQSRQPSSSYFLTPIGFGGLQFLFFTFASQGVTHFNSLGLTRAEIAVALLAPPITGAFFQPYFGNWSDQVRSPWGRRKPFIIIGTVALIFSMLCLGWAGSIAQVLANGHGPEDTPRLLVVAVAMFWTLALFIALQAVQVGLRALITDDCTPLEQAKANAWASGYTNLAAALLNLFAYMDLPLFRGVGNTVFTNMSLLAIGAVIVTIFISCMSSTEKQPDSFPQKKRGSTRSLRAIWSFFFATSKQIRRICLVQIFAWCGWFPFLFYTVTYVNGLREREVRQMPPSQAEREQSSRMGALTMLAFSVVSLIMAMLLPTLVSVLRVFNMSWLWVVTQGLFGLSMLGTYVVRSSHGTVYLFGVVGFSWAASTWVPYALLGAETSRAEQVQMSAMPRQQHRLNNNTNDMDDDDDEVGGVPTSAAPLLEQPDETGQNHHADRHSYETDALMGDGSGRLRGSGSGIRQQHQHDDDVEAANLSDKIGLIYGIHNLSICIPQILLSLGMGFVWMISDRSATSRSDEQQSADLVWILRLGGIAAFVGMYFATSLQEPFPERDLSADAYVTRLSIEGAGS